MQTDYHIEDLVYQTGDHVVYRARDKNDVLHAVTRIKFPFEILSGLEGGIFQEAYEELLTFKHPGIRTVIDGGQDPVDQFPWVATKWSDGASVRKKLEEGPLAEEELQRIRTSAEAIIEKFGPRAAAVSFRAPSIISFEPSDGTPVDTFAIDYFAWFRDWALGLPPGGGRDPGKELDNMMESLVHLTPSINAPVLQTIAKPEPLSPKTPLTPTTPASHTPVKLPSNSGGGGFKAVLVIILLSGLVGGGLWWIKNQPPKADPQVTASIEKKKDKPGEPAKIITEVPDEAPPETIKKPEPPPVLVRPTGPRRPSVGEILEVESNNQTSLNRFAGKWVFVNGEVESMDGSQIIYLKDSALKVTLKRGAVTLDPGTKVTLVGILKSPSHLEVPDNTDVEIHEKIEILPPRDVYGLKDEEQLREMNGKKATVSGKVVGFKTSNKGKTYYLLLKETKPEFAFSIRSNFGDSADLGQEFLKSLIGKNVKVNGPIKLDGIGGRLNVFFKYRSHLEISE